MKRIIKFSDPPHTVEFIPLPPAGRPGSAPGFSHRIVVNGVACDWAGDSFRPNQKVAAFFIKKHGATTLATRIRKEFQIEDDLRMACKAMLDAYARDADKTVAEEGESALHSAVRLARRAVAASEGQIQPPAEPKDYEP